MRTQAGARRVVDAEVRQVIEQKEEWPCVGVRGNRLEQQPARWVLGRLHYG